MIVCFEAASKGFVPDLIALGDSHFNTVQNTVQVYITFYVMTHESIIIR